MSSSQHGEPELSAALESMIIDRGPTPIVKTQVAADGNAKAPSSGHLVDTDQDKKNVWRTRAYAKRAEIERLEALQRQHAAEASARAARISPAQSNIQHVPVINSHTNVAWQRPHQHAGSWGHPGHPQQWPHAPQHPQHIGPPFAHQHSQDHPHPHSTDPRAQYQALRIQETRPESFTGRMHHYLMQVLLPSILPIQEETAMLEWGRRQIEGLTQEICPGGRLVPFGSLVNDLALRNSDLDLCLVLDFTPDEDTRTPRDILEILGKRIRKKIPNLYVQYKTHARIPIIKIYARRQLGGGVGVRWNKFNADVSVGNLLAIHNTRLIKAYTKVDERFRYLVIFLKLWASRRKINEAFHGTLSSYGWALMALHFFMYGVEPPILPNLQNIERPVHKAEEDLGENMVQGYDVYFFADLTRLPEYFQATNTSSLGTLIRDFFIYYSDTFKYETDVISARVQGMKKDDKGWSEDKERDHNHLCIEDPFKTDFNVGRVVQSTGFELIRSEITRAKEILLHAEQTNQYVGYVFKHLLEEGEGIVKIRERKRTDSKGKGKGKIQPPSLQDVQIPVLQKAIFKQEDFPALG